MLLLSGVFGYFLFATSQHEPSLVYNVFRLIHDSIRPLINENHALPDTWVKAFSFRCLINGLKVLD